MAFEETSDKTFDQEDGLPLSWHALEEDCCPKCLDPMAYFEDIDLWKCTCGFKISDTRKREIEAGTTGVRSFSLGDYHDEPPFGRD